MIRRAILIAGSAVVLSAVGAAAFARGGPSRQNVDTRGGFCPVRPAGSEHSALIPAEPEARMSIDPRASASADASTIGGDSLLPPAPTICRPKPDTTPARSSVQP